MKKVSGIILASLLFAIGAQGAQDHVISVTGMCERKVMPDRARITLTVSELQPDANGASKKAMAGYEDLRKDVKAMKLKDAELETSEYSVQEESDWVNNKKVHRGFRAKMGLLVSTSDIQKLGDVMVLAAKHGVQEVGSMMTYLSQEKMKETHEDCLKEAILNARAKANEMASVIGGHGGAVISIEETPRNGGAEPRFFAAAPEAKGMQLSPGIETKPEEISVNIAMSVELK